MTTIQKGIRARKRSKMTHPAVGDVVATIKDIPHLNGFAYDKPDIPRGSLGTVTGMVVGGKLALVDFGSFGKKYTPISCLNLIDVPDQVLDLLVFNSGDNLVTLLFNQRGVIYDLQAQLDQKVLDIQLAEQIFEDSIHRLETQYEAENARANGLQEQLNGLIDELMDEHRAPSRLVTTYVPASTQGSAEDQDCPA